MEFINPNPEGEFNSGLSIIFLLDGLKKHRIIAKMDNDYEKRYKINVEIMKELMPLAKDEEVATQLGMWQYAEECLDIIKEARRKGINVVHKEIIRFFDWWELEMSMLQHREGVGMPKKDGVLAAALT